MVKINGENFYVADISIEKYLMDAGYDSKRVAVELNGEIVPKVQYADTIFKDGDCIEVVCFVGGG